jgi:D-alanyl-D-alanine carboxypeptidase (penicillin-binding protein 5/6)
MIKSANDSCVAVAEGVAGTVPRFAQMMNKQRAEAGALNSHFVNPHGLHDPNHYTTAYDLAQIARAAMRYPSFNQMVRTRETEIHGNWKIGGPRPLVNKNHLLWQWNEVDGVKTGYTRQAGRCLIASATRRVRGANGQVRAWRLVSVVLHSPDVWGESARLLLNGFQYFRPAPVVARGEVFGEVDVRSGAAPVQAVSERAVEMPLRQGEKERLTRKLRWLKLKAPVAKGQRVGAVEFWSGSRVLARVPLVAGDTVPRAFLARVAPSAALPYDRTLRADFVRGCCCGHNLFFLIRSRRRRMRRRARQVSTPYARTPSPNSSRSNAANSERPRRSNVKNAPLGVSGLESASSESVPPASNDRLEAARRALLGDDEATPRPRKTAKQKMPDSTPAKRQAEQHAQLRRLSRKLILPLTLKHHVPRKNRQSPKCPMSRRTLTMPTRAKTTRTQQVANVYKNSSRGLVWPAAVPLKSFILQGRVTVNGRWCRSRC